MATTIIERDPSRSAAEVSAETRGPSSPAGAIGVRLVSLDAFRGATIAGMILVNDPGTWSTARREEDELYILVVPELNGLGPQMAGELNLWLSRQTTLLTDIASTCSSVPCLRFAYNNTPSQAWNECVK